MISHSILTDLKNVTENDAVILSRAGCAFCILHSRRTRGCRWLLLLLLAFASPALVHAQFQPPTEEELKMTADPKAPGAAAVYLYREEICDDSKRSYNFYERIKVLTEKGKELATVTIPYERGFNKVTDVQGRTIHADRSVIPMTAEPADQLDVKTKGFEGNSMVFTLPSVEVGSILEYRWNVRFTEYMPLPTWEIQRSQFIHKEHFSLHFYNPGYNTLLYAIKIDSEAKLVNKKSDYTLDLTDIPPASEEDWMPPTNLINWHLEFYLTRFGTAKAFWDYASKTWADAINDFTNPGIYLKDEVAGIIAPADNEEQKARKIYAAVQKVDNTDFSREKSKAERKKEKIKDINSAQDVWKQQTATANEVALLYVAMARAAGLKAWPMQVVNRNRAIFDNTYLSSHQLNDYIAIVELGGKDIYLDPGQKMCPFGSLNWKHALATGFRLTDKGAVIETTPAIVYKDSVVAKLADITVNESGDATGKVRVVMNGPEALHWRQLALENDETEVRKQFIESIRNDFPDGVQIDFDHFVALDNPSASLIAVINVSGSFGTITGKHFFLPGLLFETRAKHPFVAQEKRLTPIDLQYARMEQDDVIYRLPTGYTVESSPQTSDVTWPDHALLRINSGVKDNVVEVQRVSARNFTLLDPKEYNNLHDFYLKVAAADQQQLVLTRASAAKGTQP